MVWPRCEWPSNQRSWSGTKVNSRSVNNRRKVEMDRERGSTLLEFGLVAIVLFTFIFGIIDFGRALYTYHFVSNAAREATRYASVRGSSCYVSSSLPGCHAMDSNPSTAASSPVPQYVIGLATGIGLDANSVFVSASWPGSGPGTGGNGCNTTNGVDSPGCTVQIQVSYPFTFVFPLMPTTSCTISAGGQTKTANICMTSTSQMVISQ